MVVPAPRLPQTAVVVDLSAVIHAATVPAAGITAAALVVGTLRVLMVQRDLSLLPALTGQHRKLHLHQKLSSQNGSLLNELSI